MERQTAVERAPSAGLNISYTGSTGSTWRSSSSPRPAGCRWWDWPESCTPLSPSRISRRRGRGCLYPAPRPVRGSSTRGSSRWRRPLQSIGSLMRLVHKQQCNLTPTVSECSHLDWLTSKMCQSRGRWVRYRLSESIMSNLIKLRQVTMTNVFWVYMQHSGSGKQLVQLRQCLANKQSWSWKNWFEGRKWEAAGGLWDSMHTKRDPVQRIVPLYRKYAVWGVKVDVLMEMYTTTKKMKNMSWLRFLSSEITDVSSRRHWYKCRCCFTFSLVSFAGDFTNSTPHSNQVKAEWETERHQTLKKAVYTFNLCQVIKIQGH